LVQGDCVERRCEGLLIQPGRRDSRAVSGRPGELRLLPLGRLVLRQGLRLHLVDSVGLGLLREQGLRLLLRSRSWRQRHGRVGVEPHLDGPGPRLQ
jgi:hypothetical protein